MTFAFRIERCSGMLVDDTGTDGFLIHVELFGLCLELWLTRR